MNRRAYKMKWFRFATYERGQMVWSMRNNDRYEDGVIVPGTTFTVFTAPRHKRSKQ